MNEQIAQLQKELDELKSWKVSLEASSSIPLNIDQALRARLPTVPIIKASAKGNDSEDQFVNELGGASYNVLKEADDFLEVTVDGAIYYIPVYTALT